MNAATFEDWVEKCLAPTLSEHDVVVMDNLSSHKRPRVEQLIEAVGAELRYLPPLQSRHEPHRKGFFQAQGLPAQNRGAKRPRPDERPRDMRQNLQTQRMRELF
jgi:DDE superfamily endonuclease